MARKYKASRKWFKETANNRGFDYQKWWDNLSPEEKVKARDKYEKQRIHNAKRPSPYPMPDTRHQRLSQIPDKTVERIFVFKKYDEKLEKEEN